MSRFNSDQDWQSFNTACDPSWEICEQSKTANEPATANSTASASANSTVVANETESTNTMVWGLLSATQLVGGYLMYNNYNNFATSLTASSSTTSYQTQNWTSSWVKTQKPLQMWFYTAYAVMAMESISVAAWLLQATLGKDELFLKMFKVGMAYPLIELAMIAYTYFMYPSCSGTQQANWSGDTSSSDTQYVSCSGWTSGTAYIPSAVASDGLNTYAGAGATGATLLMLVNMMSNNKFTDAYGIASAPESTSAADADADADAEPASDEDAPADETAAAPADNYSSKPASQPASEPATQPADNTSTQSSSQQSAAKPADPEPEPQPTTWNSGNSWGSGWIL